jgi:hypothetical protein
LCKQRFVSLWKVNFSPGSVRGFFIAQSLNSVTFIKLRQHGPRLWTAKNFRQQKSTELKMAEECERLADQQEQATDLRQERSKRVRRREICLTEKPVHERLHEDGQKQA